jgi:hypothetical protein
VSRPLTKAHTVIAMVDSRSSADAAVDALKSAGFSPGDVSALFPNEPPIRRDVVAEEDTKAPEGAAVGAAGGSVVGGTLGVLAGIGALAIPGVGPFLAAGPLLAALSGIAAGAAVGSVAGALVGFGIPEHAAKHYEGKIRDGNILIAVHVEGGEEQRVAESALKSVGAHDVSATGETALPRG